MTTLNAQQIAGYAQAAGFTGESLVYIIAIGLAESGGNLQAISPVQSDGTRGYGLFQIETENIGNGDAWQDPQWQAATAFTLSASGTNFEPWCTACAPMPIIYNGVNYTKGCKGAGSGGASQWLSTATEAAALPVTSFGAGGGLGSTTDPDPANAASWSGNTLAANGKYLPKLAVIGNIDFSRQEQSAIVPGEWHWPYNGMGNQLYLAVSTESSVDLTEGSIPQIQLTIMDPDQIVLQSIYNSIKQQTGHEGLLCMWMDSVFIVAEIQTTTLNKIPCTILTLSSAVFAWMQTQRYLSTSELSATAWIENAIGFYNATLPNDKPAAKFNGQQTMTRANQINTDLPIVQWSSYYDYATTLAEQEGFWLFESAGGVWFGEPPWIYNNVTSSIRVGWPGIKGSRPYNLSQVDVECIEEPTILRSQVLFTGDTMTLQLPRAIGEQCRVGMVVHLYGMGVCDHVKWLINEVEFAFDGGATPVQVTCNEAKRIVPPEPGGVNPANPTTDPTNPGSGAPLAAVGGTTSTRAFVGYAQSQTGDNYVYGAETPGTSGSGAFDCSGLVQWSASQCGISMPRTAAEQYAFCAQYGQTISVAQGLVTYGALLYKGSSPASIEHTGISLGDGKDTFQAAHTGTHVGVFQDTDWNYAALLPGLSYNPAGSPNAGQANEGGGIGP